ncbi:MAG: PqqD family protein [Lachnospiraceae bacterium]|nr:PqqD family protein [Lachnospiraceae bacterium]
MKEKKNFMDFVPCCNPLYTWDTDNEGIVTVHVVNKGFYNWLAQKLFKRPRISHIKLDEYGSFVWQQMDGRRTVYEISGLVKEKFGKDAEPVINRLVQYFHILYQNKFIGYVKRMG